MADSLDEFPDDELVESFNALTEQRRELTFGRWFFRQVDCLICTKRSFPVHLLPSDDLDEEEVFQRCRVRLLDSLSRSAPPDLTKRIEVILPERLCDITDRRAEWDDDAARDIDRDLTVLWTREGLARFKQIPSWTYAEAEEAIAEIVVRSREQFHRGLRFRQTWAETVGAARTTLTAVRTQPPMTLALPSGLEATEKALSSGPPPPNAVLSAVLAPPLPAAEPPPLPEPMASDDPWAATLLPDSDMSAALPAEQAERKPEPSDISVPGPTHKGRGRTRGDEATINAKRRHLIVGAVVAFMDKRKHPPSSPEQLLKLIPVTSERSWYRWKAGKDCVKLDASFEELVAQGQEQWRAKQP